MFYFNIICIICTLLAMALHTTHVHPTRVQPTPVEPTGDKSHTNNTLAENTTIDLDAELQRSIEAQVMWGMKQERVEEYCIEQSMRYRQMQLQHAQARKAEQDTLAAAARRRERLLQLQICNSLGRLSLNRQVRWADQQEELVYDGNNSSLWTPTEVDELRDEE
jgi:hypothetical protein